MDHAHHRLMTLDQRDVDRKLTVALDKFLGAVERVDQPVFVPAGAFFERHLSGFLGQYRHLRRQLPQTGDDRSMRRHVGGGQWRIVRFGGDFEFALVDFEDADAGLAGDGDDGFQQHGRVMAHGKLQ